MRETRPVCVLTLNVAVYGDKRGFDLRLIARWTAVNFVRGCGLIRNWLERSSSSKMTGAS